VSPDRQLGDVVQGLQGRGLRLVEAFHKEGRSRRFQRAGGCTDVQRLGEEGWAVRAGGPEGAFVEAGTGLPRPDHPWPQPTGEPLRLPPRREVGSWSPGRDLEAPLLGERQGLELLGRIEAALARELPGARLENALLEDGASTFRLSTSEGIEAAWSSRLAALRLEAIWWEAGVRCELTLVEREARDLRPSELGRALADRLFVAGRGEAPEREGGTFLLAPAVGARLLEGLRPLWLGAGAASVAAALADRSGRIASPHFDLVDDGRLAQGALAAPVDGEGLPTGRVELVSKGLFERSLIPWWAADDALPGCCWRPGWRDLPAPGPGHLFLCPQPRVSPASLVAGISRGFYLLHAEAGAFDMREQRFALPVSGFAVRDGVARAPVAQAWLCGAVPSLLRGLEGVARDLRFFPLGGMLGSPSLLVRDVELQPQH
jgi:predicted Zn-dependent protease